MAVTNHRIALTDVQRITKFSIRPCPFACVSFPFIMRRLRFLSGDVRRSSFRSVESFEHVQKQSIAFFTRTQTGALISRLNSDVIGAQQAFTSTLSGVISNLLSLILVAAAMLTLSWQITLVSLTLLPVFLLPTKWVGRKLQGYTRQSFDINAQMSANMTERFNVSGALLVSLYGDPKKEKDDFAVKARKVADIGISIAMLNRIFFIALITSFV